MNSGGVGEEEVLLLDLNAGSRGIKKGVRLYWNAYLYKISSNIDESYLYCKTIDAKSLPQTSA